MLPEVPPVVTVRMEPPSDHGSGWSTRLSAWATPVTVMVAIVALLVGQQNDRRQADLGQRGQSADRLSTAVELIGSSQEDIQIGGLYALGAIIRDSPTDRHAVLAILSAYVRHHAGPVSASTAPASAEVVEALRVIGERPDPSANDFLGLGHLDLRAAHLADTDFQYAILSGVDLSDADLENADLRHADLRGANLSQADLHGANLHAAFLDGANLSQTVADATPN
jgi:hypothetical protein